MSTNLPQKARDLFNGLKEAKPDLVGVAIFDRIEKTLHQNPAFLEIMWSRRELENYFSSKEVMLNYARGQQPDDLFGRDEMVKREAAMEESIAEVSAALKTLNNPDPWGPDIKATDEFLDPVFRIYFSKLSLPLTFRKSDYHVLASYVPKSSIDAEIVAALDAIDAVAKRAIPRE
ncbi:MAG TPA: hypothetical protein VGJ05_10665 [Fimbriiglobus sp.]